MSKRKQMAVNAWINNTTWANWYNYFYSIALSVFEWENLPDSVDERFLEQSLYWFGECIFFNDEVLGNLALPTLATGPLDVYNIPITRTAYSFNGYNRANLDNKNSVIIYNNYIRTRDCAQIKMYAQRIYEIERSIDVNVKAQKTPVLISCSENQRLTLENVYNQYDGNLPVIFADKNHNINGSISSLATGSPYVADKLAMLKRQYMQEALTFLGVEANTNEKAERLVTDEVIANLGGTESMRLTRLKARQQACDKINKMFGLDIKVKYASHLGLTELMENDVKGGEDNGIL